MKSQLELFNKTRESKDPITYLDLSIHQRINVKANSAGFQATFYSWIHRPIIKAHHDFDRLTDDWFWHHSTNNRSIDTICWRNSRTLFY